MATARKCDRCGELYEIYKGVGFSDANLSKWVSMELKSVDYSSLNKHYDLCPKCMKSLLAFLNGSGEVVAQININPDPEKIAELMKKGDWSGVAEAFEYENETNVDYNHMYGGVTYNDCFNIIKCMANRSATKEEIDTFKKLMNKYVFRCKLLLVDDVKDCTTCKHSEKVNGCEFSDVCKHNSDWEAKDDKT